MRRFIPPERGNLNQGWFKCVLCGGRLWPEGMISEYNGKKYCPGHFAAKVNREKKDEAIITFIGKDYDNVRN